MDLVASGKLELVRYPGRLDSIPEDDADLVERAVCWSGRFGTKVLDQFAEYHPALLPRIRAALAESGRQPARDE
jgi:hypothetical protein